MTARPRALVTATAAALALAASGTAAAEPFIPGYTDFPNALRVADQQPKFVPGHTDFPNALRLQGSHLTTMQRAQLANAASRPVATPPRATRSGFDWGDAGIGGGVVGASVALLAAGLVTATRTRRLTRVS